MARFTRIQVALKMAEAGMIPVFFNKDAEVCKKVLEACYKGGIRLFEFTNRGDYAHVVFEQINKFAEKEFYASYFRLQEKPVWWYYCGLGCCKAILKKPHN